jgi:formiminotetrahydrofolate cyclodeaminase
MAAGLTVGRKRYLDVTIQAQYIIDEANNLRHALAAAIDEDAAAFEVVMAVMRNKDLSEEEKAEALEAATIHAGEVPLKVARMAHDAARLAKSIASIGNVNAATDAAAGAIMARAAAEAAGLNVKVNGSGLKNKTLADAWRAEVNTITEETEKIALATTLIAAERGGF